MTPNEPIYVTKPFMPPFDEFVEGLKEIWGTHILTNYGPLHKELEKALKEYLKVNHLSLFVNGHQALEIAIRSFGFHGEVITTPFSFSSTTHVVVRNGLTPVFCDIHPDNYTIDETKIESLITDKTCAILPVHVYGIPCNIEAIQKIA
jgi:dTDP-4-amino-4,6-dideoxygalactose transaminase